MSYVFKKLRDKNNPYDHSDVTVTCDADTMDELLESFKSFLMASGFSIDWHSNLEIVADVEFSPLGKALSEEEEE